MTPIERAARALAGIEAEDHIDPAIITDAWQDYLPQVRAVLAAIRDIDLGTKNDVEINMLVAGRSALPEHGEPLQEDALACWHAMIVAALEEG